MTAALQAVGARYDEALEAALRGDFDRVAALMDDVDRLVAEAGGPVTASTCALLRTVEDRRLTLTAALQAQRAQLATQLEHVHGARTVLARYAGPADAAPHGRVDVGV